MLDVFLVMSIFPAFFPHKTTHAWNSAWKDNLILLTFYFLFHISFDLWILACYRQLLKRVPSLSKSGQEPFWLQMFPTGKGTFSMKFYFLGADFNHQCRSFAPSYLLISTKTLLWADWFMGCTIKGIWKGGWKITRFSIFSIKYGHVPILNMEWYFGIALRRRFVNISEDIPILLLDINCTYFILH